MTLSEFQKTRRLLLALLLGVVFSTLFFVGTEDLGGEIHETVELCGLGLILLGVAGRMWCTLYIGGRKASEIVRTGPYSITRNPLYLFSSIAAAGVGAQTGSVTIAVIFALCCAAAFQIVIRREECYLSETFGEPYRSYLSETPRFLPNFSLFRDDREVTVRTRLLYTTLTDGLVFFAAMPTLEAIEHMQSLGVADSLDAAISFMAARAGTRRRVVEEEKEGGRLAR